MVRRYVLTAFLVASCVSNKIPAESEFWLAFGKVVLAVGLMVFTFITMVGGNPLHDTYGFRNWDCMSYPCTLPPIEVLTIIHFTSFESTRRPLCGTHKNWPTRPLPWLSDLPDPSFFHDCW